MQGFAEFMRLSEVSLKEPFRAYFGDNSILDNHTIIVFDTETTGLDTRIPHVQIVSISAAAFSLDEEKLTQVFDKFIDLTPSTRKRMEDESKYSIPNPAQKYNVIDDFLQVSKWHEAEKGGDEEKVLTDFVNFVNSFPNPILVGYNAGFDMRMINSTLKKYGKKPIRYPVIDVMKFAHLFVDPALEHLARQGHVPSQEALSGLKNKFGKKSFTLSNVANALGIVNAGAHVSLNDILMTGKVLSSAIRFIKDNQDKISDDYHKDLGKSYRDYRNKMNFFRMIRNDGFHKHRSKQRAIDLINHDVFSGVQSYSDYLANLIRRENRRSKPNRVAVESMQKTIDNLKAQLDSYSGDPTEIIKTIYNS